LFATARKWIPFSPEEGQEPLVFSIRLDDSSEIYLGSVKIAIKNKVPGVRLSRLVLEHPLGTVLSPDDTLISTVKGGDADDPIHARLTLPREFLHLHLHIVS